MQRPHRRGLCRVAHNAALPDWLTLKLSDSLLAYTAHLTVARLVVELYPLPNLSFQPTEEPHYDPYYEKHYNTDVSNDGTAWCLRQQPTNN